MVSCTIQREGKDKHSDKELTELLDTIQKQMNEATKLIDDLIDSTGKDITRTLINLLNKNIEHNVRVRSLIMFTTSGPRLDKVILTLVNRNNELKKRLNNIIHRGETRPTLKPLVDIAATSISLLDGYNAYLSNYIGVKTNE